MNDDLSTSDFKEFVSLYRALPLEMAKLEAQRLLADNEEFYSVPGDGMPVAQWPEAVRDLLTEYSRIATWGNMCIITGST